MLGYSNIILFLVGTTLSSGHVLRNKMRRRSWNPADNRILLSPPAIGNMHLSAGPPPLLSKYWPQKTNLFYKPHIMMTPVRMPISAEFPQKDCDEHKETIKFPPIVEIIEHKEPLVIPQAPELSPLLTPEIPAPIQLEVVPPSKPEEIQILQISDFKPIEIPKAPELSSFVMPEIPAFVEETPCHPEVTKPIEIPTAPELPPIELPELPAPIQEEIISLHSPAPPCSPEDEKNISEFRPLAPELPPLYLPEPEFIPSYSPMEPIKMEFKPIQIPTAPELPPLSFPELPAPVQVEVMPSYSPETPCQLVELTPEYRPINIPAAPELPPLSMPELPALPEITSNIIEETPALEFKPLMVDIPSAPQLPPLTMTKLPTTIDVAPAPEFQPFWVNIPAAPEIPPSALQELPAPIEIISNKIEEAPVPAFPELPALVQVEAMPPYCPEPPCQLVELTPEYRPINIPTAPELPPLSMPELPALPEITSNIIEETPAPEFKPLMVDIPSAPELPPLTMTKLPTTIDVAPAPEFQPLWVNIPAAPELPPSALPELPAPVQVEVISSYSPEPPRQFVELTPEYAPINTPMNIPAAPQLPPLAIEPISIELYVPETPQKEIKPLVIPEAPELPPFLAPIVIPAAPLLEEKPVHITEYKPLPNPPELPPFVTHKMEPMVFVDPATYNNEEPCKNEEGIGFLSEAPRSPTIYPIFLAQNIIIERVIPNLYLSHNSNTDTLNSAGRRDAVFNNAKDFINYLSNADCE